MTNTVFVRVDNWLLVITREQDTIRFDAEVELDGERHRAGRIMPGIEVTTVRDLPNAVHANAMLVLGVLAGRAITHGETSLEKIAPPVLFQVLVKAAAEGFGGGR